jgi:hypothetical protein
VIRIEIATDYNAFNAGYRRSDHVPHGAPGAEQLRLHVFKRPRESTTRST